NVLNNLKKEREYSINELSENSGLHWKTTKDYIDLLIHLFKFAPKMKYNLENGRIKILEQSSYYNELTPSQKILLYLYENKAFDKASAFPIQEEIFGEKVKIHIEDLILKEQISQINSTEKYVITKRGKVNIIELYSDITSEIFNFKELKEKPEKKSLEDKYMSRIVKQNNKILEKLRFLASQNRKLDQKVNSLYSINRK
ncbi:MAG: hypothetical protein P8Y97_24175, partial [Candidatus Lokiarchaeota archaeon]